MEASLFSLPFLLLFLPAVVVLFALAPARWRGPVLLGASYVFYWMISGKLLVYLLVSTLSVHYAALWLGLLQKRQKARLQQAQGDEKKKLRVLFRHQQRRIVLAIAVLHIGTLAVLKYSSFLAGNLNSLLTLLHWPALSLSFRFAVPLGISFFSLQALSYLLDVYHEKIPADTHLGRLALFLAFFPQIVEGPICRWQQTACQLWQPEAPSFQRLTLGIQRILLGVMKKVVIADRLNLFIQNLFDRQLSDNGALIALAALFYTCQLYMEFSGSLDVVCGSAEMLGVTMPENFRQPFFSRTISEFWQRWHITLGTWFKDYLFYPLSMSAPLKSLTRHFRRKWGTHASSLLSGAMALLVVWCCNGLWHGAGWHYLFFGLFHFTLILGGSLIAPLGTRLTATLKIPVDKLPWRLFQMVRTTLLVALGELFFRANGLALGLKLFTQMIGNFSLTPLLDGTVLTLGMDLHDFFIVAIALWIVLVYSVMKERGKDPRQLLAQRRIAVRWPVYYGLILFIVIFGAYGSGYIPVDPIYANF